MEVLRWKGNHEIFCHSPPCGCSPCNLHVIVWLEGGGACQSVIFLVQWRTMGRFIPTLQFDSDVAALRVLMHFNPTWTVQAIRLKLVMINATDFLSNPIRKKNSGWYRWYWSNTDTLCRYLMSKVKYKITGTNKWWDYSAVGILFRFNYV